MEHILIPESVISESNGELETIRLKGNGILKTAFLPLEREIDYVKVNLFPFNGV
jgi:hypothetical protein